MASIMALSPFLLALLPVAAKVIPAAAAVLVAWLTHRHVSDGRLQKALDWLDRTAPVAVRSVAQTYLDDLTEAAKDGVLTDEEKARALEKAVDAVLAMTPPSFAAVLRVAYGERLGSVIKGFLEAAVHSIKKKI